MANIYLTVKPLAGTPIKDAISDAWHLSKHLGGIPVSFKFNGCPLMVYSHQTLLQAYTHNMTRWDEFIEEEERTRNAEHDSEG